MSRLVLLCVTTFSCFFCHVTSVALLSCIIQWLGKKERQDPSTSMSRYPIVKSGAFGNEEICSSNRTEDPSVLYKRFILVNVLVFCVTGFIYSLYLYGNVSLVHDLLTYLPRLGTKEKHVPWMIKSIKHRSRLEKLKKALIYNSHSVTKIGEIYVYFIDDFCIGKGMDKIDVFLGLSTDGVEVSVKRMDLQLINHAKTEKKTLNWPKLAESPFVLNYRFYVEDRENAYLVTDLHEENLKQYVQSTEHTQDKLQKKGPSIFKQILLGLCALHNANILHRHLKPENVLVNLEGNMVLADFGICRPLKLDETTHNSGIRGEDGWVAVESLPSPSDDKDIDLQGNKKITVQYHKKSDIQVLGMIFYFVLTKGKHPFGTWDFERLSNIRKNAFDLKELTDPAAKDLIQWMLQYNKTERPFVEQCLRHPYLISPEENLKFLKAVGNEKEIKMCDNSSIVVQTLNDNDSHTIPPWSKEIDEEVYRYFSRRRVYSKNRTELLRFIRNAAAHWPSSFLERFGRPQTYFLKLFPTLPVIVHNVLRNDPDWTDRYTLKQYFCTM